MHVREWKSRVEAGATAGSGGAVAVAVAVPGSSCEMFMKARLIYHTSAPISAQLYRNNKNADTNTLGVCCCAWDVKCTFIILDNYLYSSKLSVITSNFITSFLFLDLFKLIRWWENNL